MATPAHVSIVEQAIGYQFKTRSLLAQALTAAGAEEENHEGNRRLALFGEHLIQFLISWGGYKKEGKRAVISDLTGYAGSKKQRALAARRTGISECIKFSPRSVSDSVLSLAVSAIIGATWEDSMDLNTVAKVILRLGITTEVQDSVPPQVVLLDHTTSSDSTETPVERLFNENFVPPPQPIANPTIPPAPQATVQPPDNHFGLLANPDSSSSVDATIIREEEVTLGHNLMSLEEMASTFFISASPAPADHTGMFQYLPSSGVQLPLRRSHSEIEELRTSPSTSTGEDGAVELQSLVITASAVAERGAARGATRGAEKQSKRARRSANQDLTQSTGDSLNPYLEKELLRCQSQALPGPVETFFSADIQQQIAESGNEKLADMLKVICMAIASPEALATLQLLVRRYRADGRFNVPAPAMTLSITERYSVIEDVGREMAYMNLLRRCHIVKLYEDNRQISPGSDDGFVLSTQQTVATQGRKSAGNPNKIAESKVTKVILEQVCPNLDPDSQGYKTKYRSVNNLRKLGQRLHMLKSRFGDGILGLIQCAEYELEIELPLNLNITDQMLLAPTDHVFEEFIALLDASQGHILRRFSYAVSPIIKSVLEGTVGHSGAFPIENVEQGRILELPKGSDALLHLISQETSLATFADK